MLKSLRSGEAAMPFIMLAVLIDLVAIGVIIPVLPALVGSFSRSPADQAYWYGVVAVSFGVSNFLASPMLGALSDHFGRRPLLLLGFLGLALSFFGTAWSTSIWGLIGVRIVAGASRIVLLASSPPRATRAPRRRRAWRTSCAGSSYPPRRRSGASRRPSVGLLLQRTGRTGHRVGRLRLLEPEPERRIAQQGVGREVSGSR